MLRRCLWKLCSVTLGNGTVLSGRLNPLNRELLLQGTATLPDGRVYSGSFDPTHGFPLPGCQLTEDGDHYCGAFNAQWQREGEGEAWLSDGTHYRGRFQADELVEGVVRIPNGTTEAVFEGTLCDESFVRGTLTQHDFVYVGEFKDNQPHGKGRLTFTTGAEQEGTFYRGKLHGEGCKMKLDSGFVYVGEFMDGVIRRGTLYTRTYTYEGDFNEHGRAHGEGTQTYLATTPRLIFTGIWSDGNLEHGVCVDEDGTPVDWKNNHTLQERVLTSEGHDAREAMAMNAYCEAKLDEASRLHRDLNRSYAEDAAAVAQDTGSYPSRMDLGYEAGMRTENEAAERAAERQRCETQRARVQIPRNATQYDAAASEVRRNVVGEINENMAKVHFYRQRSAEQLSKERADEQFERFLKTFDRPPLPPTRVSAPTLNIDSENAPWKSFTSAA